MSFINFMIHGSNSPAFENIFIKHNEDNRQVWEITDPILPFNQSCQLLDSNQNPLITFDFPSVNKAKDTWKKFETQAFYLSYFSTFASIGLLSWKALSARSFVKPGFLNVVGAVAFGVLALRAYSRGSQSASLEDETKLYANTLNAINTFRNNLLSLKPYAVTISQLPAFLHSRADELLTESEKSYILYKLISLARSDKEVVKSLQDFCKAYKTSANTSEFDSAFINFSKSIDFDKMQDKGAKLYSDWVNNYIYPHLLNFMDCNSFSVQMDRYFAKLFKEFYENNITKCLKTDSKEYPVVFGEICKTILSKNPHSQKNTIEYIRQEAVEDFNRLLFAPDFQKYISDVLKEIGNTKTEFEHKKAKEWLTNKFNTIQDEKIKTILLESLELNPSKSEILGSGE